MTMDRTIETSEPITTGAGTFRVRVENDPYGTNPRTDGRVTVGTMVCNERNFDRPCEGDLSGQLLDLFERYDSATAYRMVSLYLRMARGAVVVPVYSTGNDNRLTTSGGRPREIIGVIYMTRTEIAEHWPVEFGSVPTDVEIADYLSQEVAEYDAWSCNEMTEYVIERRCDKCQEWREVGTSGTYFSVEEAMDVARGSIPDDADTSAYRLGTVELRCDCESTVPSSLSDDARAVIAGLVADSSAQDINTDGITAPDGVWSEIRAAFPIELFRAWATDDNYNPHAGY